LLGCGGEGGEAEAGEGGVLEVGAGVGEEDEGHGGVFGGCGLKGGCTMTGVLVWWWWRD